MPGEGIPYKDITYSAQTLLQISYKSEPIEKTYIPDFICYDGIIVEIKALSKLAPEHRAQLHNYLKATGFLVGYLINFGHFPRVEFDRVIRSGD